MVWGGPFAFLEEGEVVGAAGEHLFDDELEEALGEGDVVFEGVEGGFGFDHPEFGEVAGGVGVFGAEGWAEGVDFTECGGEDLAFELAGDG